MTHLHQILGQQVDQWRTDGYPCPDYPAVAEIFEWARDDQTGSLRFLRRPQLRALETYWYLRLIEKTPHVFDLYSRLFPSPPDLMAALGLTSPALMRQIVGQPLESLWDRIKIDDAFVREHHLESLRETLTLGYASYILGLAMGAGKTILICAVFATEFAMALEYPEGPFVQNALVFAPGKTIIESLRELLSVSYDRILPPRMHKSFAASVKLTFTRDGDKDIPVVRESLYNVVVTNTEKIRIQKETVRRGDLGGLFARGKEDEARAEVANLRLQAIASLPHLAVFSDEAHHTYGQSLQTELKKVRKTVDYLAANTNVLAVVNTTGTPYFKRQPLRDVVVWYGLSEGIRDNILKDVSGGNIRAFSLDQQAEVYVAHVIEDFFQDYGAVHLPDGAPARLAVYFPQTDDLERLRPAIDQALATIGQSPTLCLRNTSDSTRDEIDAFNRLNDPAAPHRVILLVNKGTEGWNCPSLFACALARRLSSANNFVLQTATRCLRQVPGNAHKARIYLSHENRAILDRQLQETYGETIADLARTTRERGARRLKLRKVNPPPLSLTRVVRTVVAAAGSNGALQLERPKIDPKMVLTETALDILPRQGLRSVLRETGQTIVLEVEAETLGHCEAAVQLAAACHIDIWAVYDALRSLYPHDDVPAVHVADLARQISEHAQRYEVREERVEWAIALVKPGGFSKTTEPDGTEAYVAEITYPKDKEDLLLSAHRVVRENPAGFGFHYDPYNFDSRPELDFYQQVLAELNVQPAEVEDIYFTGGITDPAKTDFYVEYRGEDGRWHRYTPDFVIRKRARPGQPAGSGRVLIVEIKAPRFAAVTRADLERAARKEEAASSEGRKAIALARLAEVNPDRLKYELLFVDGPLGVDQMSPVQRFVREPERPYAADIVIATKLKERILAADGTRVSRIILFGSRARGDARPDSDYDVLVIVRGATRNELRAYHDRLYDVLRGLGATAEPWVMTEEEFEETRTVIGGLAYPAWTEGVVLHPNA
jgi:type III restriction enzyme